jgi:hypothetical protein
MAMPKGHGNRVSKPPSRKQKAQADRISQQPAYSPSTAGLPSESWWLKPGALDQPEAEQLRMRASRFGRAQTPTLLEP